MLQSACLDVHAAEGVRLAQAAYAAPAGCVADAVYRPHVHLVRQQPLEHGHRAASLMRVLVIFHGAH